MDKKLEFTTQYNCKCADCGVTTILTFDKFDLAWKLIPPFDQIQSILFNCSGCGVRLGLDNIKDNKDLQYDIYKYNRGSD